MKHTNTNKMISLDTSVPIWDHFFTVAPLVVIGTKEKEAYDLAPKHMVTPLGRENYFGFVCTPRHATYQNIKENKIFTVSFPRPDQVVLTSLAASPRCDAGDIEKPIIDDIPTFKAPNVDALLLNDSYLFLECELHQIIDGFGDYSLIAGRIIGAFVHEDGLRSSELDEQALIYQAPLLAYLANGRFATIKESLAYPFPKEFKI